MSNSKDIPSLVLGASEDEAPLLFNPTMANRHGIVTGATGSGKTVTLQVLAEYFSAQGVPVFTADVKGDLSGISKAGTPNKKIDERLAKIPISDYSNQGAPVVFWDVFAKNGHPIRTTISEMGPLLISELLDLNETQSSLLHVGFSLADDHELLLIDLKDLQSLLAWMSEEAKTLRSEYGNISPQSIGAIQRKLLVLREAGGERFFGEPALRLSHLLQHDFGGRGVISVLDASTLIQNPKIYSTFLLWLLAELFEQLEEVGDQELPKLVFFFDEAHLLFNSAPKALLQKIEQVVRLIRSKGVGVFFVTQNPSDVPDSVLRQLGNKIQHTLRAYTPRDKKALRAAADSFRQNPAFDTEEVIQELGTGEALVSLLNSKGQPEIAQRILVSPPRSQIGPISKEERSTILSRSPLAGIYDKAVDRNSAFEMLKQRRDGQEEKEEGSSRMTKSSERTTRSRKSNRQGFGEAFVKSMLRSIGGQLGRQITRGIMGSFK
jgi:hypothetical protein